MPWVAMCDLILVMIVGFLFFIFDLEYLIRVQSSEPLHAKMNPTSCLFGSLCIESCLPIGLRTFIWWSAALFRPSSLAELGRQPDHASPLSFGLFVISRLFSPVTYVVFLCILSYFTISCFCLRTKFPDLAALTKGLASWLRLSGCRWDLYTYSLNWHILPHPVKSFAALLHLI
jgi:hypothetical protein